MISTIWAEDVLDAGARLGEISTLTPVIGGGCDRFYPTEGYINNAIASRLYLSPKIVRNNLSSIFTKLEVSDRSQAIVHTRGPGWEREEVLR
jgi:hypothetical protein